MGRHKTPRHILQARGSWKAETRAEVEVPDRGVKLTPPAWFPKDRSCEARKEWDLITKVLAKDGRTTQRDATIIASYCIAVQDFISTLDAPTTLKSPATKEVKLNPKFVARQKAQEMLLKHSARLGLTETDRANLAVPIGETKDAKVSAARFLRKNG